MKPLPTADRRSLACAYAHMRAARARARRAATFGTFGRRHPRLL